MYAMTGGALMAVFICRMMLGKLDMMILMFATLAGGVMIAASSNLIFNAGYAMIVGCLGGIASSLGYFKLDKFMEDKVKIHLRSSVPSCYTRLAWSYHFSCLCWICNL
jgi:ammonia channel protein AmtB